MIFAAGERSLGEAKHAVRMSNKWGHSSSQHLDQRLEFTEFGYRLWGGEKMKFGRSALIIVLLLASLMGVIMAETIGSGRAGVPPSCARYLKYIEEDGEYQKLIEWADKEIFSRKFQESEFISGNFSGPGLRHYTINLAKSGVSSPEWLLDYEVRVMGDSLPEFSAIFVGGGRYAGLVVSRDEWDVSVNDRIIPSQQIKLRRERIALVCHVEP